MIMRAGCSLDTGALGQEGELSERSDLGRISRRRRAARAANGRQQQGEEPGEPSESTLSPLWWISGLSDPLGPVVGAIMEGSSLSFPTSLTPPKNFTKWKPASSPSVIIAPFTPAMMLEQVLFVASPKSSSSSCLAVGGFHPHTRNQNFQHEGVLHGAKMLKGGLQPGFPQSWLAFVFGAWWVILCRAAPVNSPN